MTVDALASALSGGDSAIPRDRWGRPLITPPGGGKPVAYTRCTTFVGALEDGYNLTKWKQRQTALGIAARKDLHLRISSLGTQPEGETEAKRWKRQLDDVCEQAMEAAGSSSAATIGTALHSFTESIDHGYDVVAPAEYRKHLDNYRRATAGFERVMIEQFVIHDGYRIGGTADRVFKDKVSGRLIIGDIKTGNVEFPHKIAMQLAVYANSVMYDHETGTRTPFEDIDTEMALIVHLDAKTGDCNLHWVDIQAGWEAVDLAAKVRAWRDRKGLTLPVPTHYEAVATATDILNGVPALDAAIQSASSIDQLVGLRQTFAAAWTDHHTGLLTQRVAQIALGAA